MCLILNKRQIALTEKFTGYKIYRLISPNPVKLSSLYSYGPNISWYPNVEIISDREHNYLTKEEKRGGAVENGLHCLYSIDDAKRLIDRWFNTNPEHVIVQIEANVSDFIGHGRWSDDRKMRQIVFNKIKLKKILVCYQNAKPKPKTLVWTQSTTI